LIILAGIFNYKTEHLKNKSTFITGQVAASLKHGSKPLEAQAYIIFILFIICQIDSIATKILDTKLLSDKANLYYSFELQNLSFS